MPNIDITSLGDPAPVQLTDRSAETPMPACSTHPVELRLIVRGQLPKGIEAHHLFEYIQAHLGNRQAELHEDIFDELEGLTLECEVVPNAHDASVAEAVQYLSKGWGDNDQASQFKGHVDTLISRVRFGTLCSHCSGTGYAEEEDEQCSICMGTGRA